MISLVTGDCTGARVPLKDLSEIKSLDMLKNDEIAAVPDNFGRV
jgi:hypothetical protein